MKLQHIKRVLVKSSLNRSTLAVLTDLLGRKGLSMPEEELLEELKAELKKNHVDSNDTKATRRFLADAGVPFHPATDIMMALGLI